jgi:hypothetical protein
MVITLALAMALGVIAALVSPAMPASAAITSAPRHVATATPHGITLPQHVRVPSAPPNKDDCKDPSQHLNTYTDPETGAKYICWCPAPGTDVCGWALLLSVPNPATWANVNVWEQKRQAMYIDVTGPSHNQGTPLHIWTYTGGGSQWWNMNYIGSASMHPSSKYTPSMCIGVPGSSTSRGTQLVQFGCNNHTDQHWIWVWTGNVITDNTGTWPIFNIVDVNSRMCIGVAGAGTTIGSPIVQWTCNGSPDQQWF